MKRGQALAAALALILGTQAIVASAKTACLGCKAHNAHRRAHIHRRARGSGYLPPPIPSQRALPVPTLPERRFPPGVAPPSPFLPNNLPPTYLPQKL